MRKTTKKIVGSKKDSTITKLLNKPAIGELKKVSRKFCKHFSLPYCDVYYINRISDDAHTYYNIDSMKAAIHRKTGSPIGMLMHELAHHMELNDYPVLEDGHGYYFQLAIRRTIRWCQKHISAKHDWRIPIGGTPTSNKELRAFQKGKKRRTGKGVLG